MTLKEVKSVLPTLERLLFKLPDGSLVPAHFHVTEVGKISKHFIDCGGTVRQEEAVNFQLWSTDDVDHRLRPDKLLHIIELSERTLELGDVEIEVEYQTDTIGKFGLDFDGTHFVLTSKQTDCLAKENCGIPEPLTVAATSTCTPGGGCC